MNCARSLGGDCSNISYDAETNTITVSASEEQVKNNEGLALIRDLAQSSSKYDLFIGSKLETAAGNKEKQKVDVNYVKNLDNNKDDRLAGEKLPNHRPRQGIDGQVAFNPETTVEVDPQKSAKLVAANFMVIFHELAEAYAKVDHGKQYDAAHREAAKREIKLREQRPYYRVHNMGAAPGVIIVPK